MKETYIKKAVNGNYVHVNCAVNVLLRDASVGGDMSVSAVSASASQYVVEVVRPGVTGVEKINNVALTGEILAFNVADVKDVTRVTIKANYGTNCTHKVILDLVAPRNLYYFTYTDADGEKHATPLHRQADRDAHVRNQTYYCYGSNTERSNAVFFTSEGVKLNNNAAAFVATEGGYFDFGNFKNGAIVADVETLDFDEVTDITITPQDAYSGNSGGGEGGMSQYILTLSGNTFYHNGEAVDYATIAAAIRDVNKFVYLDFSNALHLPCFIIEEGNEALAFSSAFSVDSQPHIERVAINAENVIKIDNYALVAYTNNNGVNLGTGANASGNYAVAEGNNTTASGNYSHAEGVNTKATKAGTHAEGAETTASGNYSHAEGYKTTASGVYAHAEGHSTTATAEDAHAEGHDTHATGTFAHAEGNGTIAGADTSHAEGYATSATANNAHAEGNNTLAQGVASHSEGIGSQALGDYSHVQNQDCVARGQASAAAGWRSIANTKSEFVVGEWNVQQAETPQQRGEYMFIGGNGTAEANHNAFAFGWDGSLSLFKSDGSAVKLTPELLESLLSLL